MVRTSAAMENRVENLERSFNEWRLENQAQMEELLQLLTQRNHRRRGRTSRCRDESLNSNSSTSRSRSRTRDMERTSPPHYGGRKMDLPIFNGDEAHGWIVRVERFFRINMVREEEKLDAIMIALEGRALNWYQWWEEHTSELSWEEFKKAVIRRFKPGLVQNPLGPLLSIKQTGTMMEYRECFEMLIAPLRREERVMLDNIFINGLQEEIQAELKLHESRNLAELMDGALLIEEKNKATLKGKRVVKEKMSGVQEGVGGSSEEGV